MQGETKFKLKIRPELEALPHSWWVKTQMVAMRGIPDFLGCVNGLFIALELKVEGKEAEPLQGWIIRKIIQAGGFGVVVTPKLWPDVHSYLNEISRGKPFRSVHKSYFDKQH